MSRNVLSDMRAQQIQILGAFWITKDAKFRHADNEDSDQTAHEALMRRLIWVFVVCSFQKVFFFRCNGKNNNVIASDINFDNVKL